MRPVTDQNIAMATKMASKVGDFFHCHLFACHPGGHWSNIEQLVAQWWHLEASGTALDMLHWAMCFVLHQCTAMAIEMASRGGALFPIINFLS